MIERETREAIYETAFAVYDLTLTNTVRYREASRQLANLATRGVAIETMPVNPEESGVEEAILQTMKESEILNPELLIIFGGNKIVERAISAVIQIPEEQRPILVPIAMGRSNDFYKSMVGPKFADRREDALARIIMEGSPVAIHPYEWIAEPTNGFQEHLADGLPSPGHAREEHLTDLSIGSSDMDPFEVAFHATASLALPKETVRALRMPPTHKHLL
jgi:hypothetical protein